MVKAPPLAPLIVMLSCWRVVCWGELESVTLTVNGDVPAVVGMPVIAPVLGLSVAHVGSEPLVMLKVYGDVPPAATTKAL